MFQDQWFMIQRSCIQCHTFVEIALTNAPNAVSFPSRSNSSFTLLLLRRLNWWYALLKYERNIVYNTNNNTTKKGNCPWAICRAMIQQTRSKEVGALTMAFGFHHECLLPLPWWWLVFDPAFLVCSSVCGKDVDVLMSLHCQDWLVVDKSGHFFSLCFVLLLFVVYMCVVNYFSKSSENWG